MAHDDKRHPFVYLSGPITQGRPTRLHNVADATAAFRHLLRRGVYAFVPQWSALLDYCLEDVSYEEWLALDLSVILRCDGLVRLPGESAGADREVAIAETAGVPVFDGSTWREACDRAVMALTGLGSAAESA